MAADLTVVKGRQQQAWAAGNYAKVGNYLVIVGEQLCESVDVRAGQRALDVATGSGLVPRLLRPDDQGLRGAGRRWSGRVRTRFPGYRC